MPQTSRKGLLITVGAIVVVGAALLAFAVGYLGYEELDQPAASPSPAAGVKYDTAAAVMDAMRDKGLACEGYKTIPIEQYDERALQSAFCKTSDGAELNVSIYASAEDARTSVQRLFDQPAQSAYGKVGTYGENWAVHVSYSKRGWIDDVARALGSSIIDIPPKS